MPKYKINLSDEYFLVPKAIAQCPFCKGEIFVKIISFKENGDVEEIEYTCRNSDDHSDEEKISQILIEKWDMEIDLVFSWLHAGLVEFING